MKDNSNSSENHKLLSRKKTRWLLSAAKDDNSTLKLKLAGTGWQSGYHKIIHVSETSIVIIDEKANLLKFISLADITEFSLNQTLLKKVFQQHYEVTG
ncbi:MAG TPA: hypothetical protein VGD40_25115 [Chryseosolibacter sp.]